MTSFHKGWSGSEKHTGTQGDGSQMNGGPGSAPSQRGPNAGVGKLGGVNMTWGSGSNGDPKVKGMKRQSEE